MLTVVIIVFLTTVIALHWYAVIDYLCYCYYLVVVAMKIKLAFICFFYRLILKKSALTSIPLLLVGL